MLPAKLAAVISVNFTTGRKINTPTWHHKLHVLSRPLSLSLSLSFSLSLLLLLSFSPLSRADIRIIVQMRRPKSCRELIKHLTWSYRQFARRYNCPANKTMFFRARLFFFSPLNVRRVPSRILHHRAISECKHYLYIYARACTFTSIRIWMNEKRYSPSDISMKAFRVARFSARHTAESIGNLWKRLYRKRKKERERVVEFYFNDSAH